MNKGKTPPRYKHYYVGYVPKWKRIPNQKRYRPIVGGDVRDNGWFYHIVSNRFICFNCRKSWRRHQRQPYMTICPHCGKTVRLVHPMFRAPKRTDNKRWRQLERLYR